MVERHPRVGRVAERTGSAGLATGRAVRVVVRRLRGRRLVQAGLGALLVALMVGGYVGLGYLSPDHPGQQVPLTTIMSDGAAHQVSSARLLDQDARVVATLSSGSTVWATYTRSDSETARLVSVLSTSGPVSVDSQTAKATVRLLLQFLFPILVLATLFGLLFTAGRGEGGAKEFAEFSKIRRGVRTEGAPRRRRGTPTVTFASVAGAATAVVELAEVVDYLADPTRYAEVGALPPKGILLVGPPGCGKTLLARAVAGEAGVPFYSLSGSEFVESLVGVGAARVRDLFAQLRRAAPAILFIDELDAAGRKRGAGVGGGNDEREQTLNQILVEMDGFAASGGIVVIVATNLPDILDPALFRPGRFDRHVTVDRPDASGRFDILRLYATGRPLAADVDLETLARRTPGFTGAELANVWNEAALLTVRAGEKIIGMATLDEAIERVISGPKRSSAGMPAEDRRLLAVHEAGHAVAAAALGLGGRVERVSIARRGLGLGHTALLREDRLLLRRSELIDRITIAVSGMVAEELVFAESSTGAEGDIEAATDLARDMAGRYGMSAGIGPVRVTAKDAEVFLGRDLAALAAVSPETMGKLDEEIHEIIDDCVRRARGLLGVQREALLEMADRLGELETLDGPVLRAVLEQVASTAAGRQVMPADGARPSRRRQTSPV